jgi:hypothetical protein
VRTSMSSALFIAKPPKPVVRVGPTESYGKPLGR